MSNLQEMIEATTIEETITILTQHLKSAPNDKQSRTALFEFLCLAGDYDRAEKQLKALDSQNQQPDLALKIYQNTLEAERNRQQLLLSKAEITFLMTTPDYINNYISVIELYAKGELDLAQEALEEAEKLRPHLRGAIDGKPFSDLRDYHDLHAPVLEMINHNNYLWLPFDQLKSISIHKPVHLRDVIWTTVEVETRDNQKHSGFIPSIYVNSNSQSDELVRMGRKTAWGDLESPFPIVFGLKEFLVDDEEVTIFDINHIQFN